MYCTVPVLSDFTPVRITVRRTIGSRHCRSCYRYVPVPVRTPVPGRYDVYITVYVPHRNVLLTTHTCHLPYYYRVVPQIVEWEYGTYVQASSGGGLVVVALSSVVRTTVRYGSTEPARTGTRTVDEVRTTVDDVGTFVRYGSR